MPMPRIRTIKPEFWSSPSIGALEYDTRLLFSAAGQRGQLDQRVRDQRRVHVDPREVDGSAPGGRVDLLAGRGPA